MIFVRPKMTADLVLAEAAAGGSDDAWHEFVLRYSKLVLATVRRYMTGFDVDAHRNVYVDVLAQMRTDALQRYDGSITLASWVIIVSRSRALDAVRAEHGRKRRPAWLRSASEFDARVFQLFYLEGLDAGRVVEALQAAGHAADTAAVHAALNRLDARIDRRTRTRLAYELQARTSGGAIARLREYSDEMGREAAQTEAARRPDALLAAAELRRQIVSLRAHVAVLPVRSRQVLELYYWDGLGPTEIAQRMTLGSRRQAEGLLQRAVAELRRIWKTGGSAKSKVQSLNPSDSRKDT